MRLPAGIPYAIALLLASSLAGCGSTSASSFTLVSELPADGATGVPLNSTVSATFSSAIAPGTLSAASFTLSPGASGTLSVSGATARFTPTTDLQPDTTYRVTISGTTLNQAGQALGAPASWSFTTGTSRDDTPPAQVTTLAAGAATTTTIPLTWTAVGNDGTSGTAALYDLRHATGGGCPITANNFSGATPVSTSAPQAAGQLESVTAPNLVATTTYCFALIVADQAGNRSPLSNVVTAATASSNDTTAPGTVSDLGANADSSTSVALVWTAPGNDGAVGTAASYHLRYATGAGCPLTSANFSAGTAITTPSPQAGGGREQVEATGLAPSTTYCFALTASDPTGNTSGLSNVATATTPAPGGGVPPDPVADLAAAVDGTDPTVIDLTWTATGDHGSTGTAAAYRLRYLSSTCPSDGTFDFAHATPVTTAAPKAVGSSETLSVPSLPQGHDYCFALQVLDHQTPPDVSDLSNLADVSLADTLPPTAVADLRLGAASTNESFQLKWSAPSDNASGMASYELLYTAGPCPAHAANFDLNSATSITDGLPAPAAANSAQTATLAGFDPRTEYCFALRSTDSASNVSGLSNLLDATSGDDLPPSAVGDLSSTNQTTTSIELTWTAPGDDGSNTVRVNAYDLRMHQAAANATDCTAFNYTTATPVASGAPGAPDSAETQTVSGLSTGTNYCFAIKSSDVAGNVSAISNLLFVTTL